MESSCNTGSVQANARRRYCRPEPNPSYDYRGLRWCCAGFQGFRLWAYLEFEGMDTVPTVPVLLALLTFPLINFKSPPFFTKFNILDTVFVMYLLFFTFSKALECDFNVDIWNEASPNFAALYNLKFPALTGTLALSYFIHNAVLTVLRNQKNPENNARDLSIGYALSAICYIFTGFTFYSDFPTFRSCIAVNFLNNFGSGDVLSAAAQVFLLFQMITVPPLLIYLIRAQLSYLATGDVYPGLSYVCLLNLGIISIAVLFAIFYPYVSSILRYVGSLSLRSHLHLHPAMHKLFFD